MAIFLKTGEIRTSLGALVNHSVKDCEKSGEIPQELSELIKHNFLAKYVYYNKKEKMIEVGINESKHRSANYPSIKVYTFPVDKTDDWLDNSFKTGKADLEFYGKLINERGNMSSSEIVVV